MEVPDHQHSTTATPSPSPSGGVSVELGVADFRARAVLRDGTPVFVRAIRPDDKERLRIAFECLSARSVYQRFMHPVTALSSKALRELTEVDFRDHVALVVTIAGEAGERLIGVGRFVRMPGAPDRAEVGFTVADEYQHCGVATLLLQELVAIARRGGVRELEGIVLEDNRDMLEVLEHSKLPMRQAVEHGVRRVVLTLAPHSL